MFRLWSTCFRYSGSCALCQGLEAYIPAWKILGGPRAVTFAVSGRVVVDIDRVGAHGLVYMLLITVSPICLESLTEEGSKGVS